MRWLSYARVRTSPRTRTNDSNHRSAVCARIAITVRKRRDSTFYLVGDVLDLSSFRVGCNRNRRAPFESRTRSSRKSIRMATAVLPGSSGRENSSRTGPTAVNDRYRGPSNRIAISSSQLGSARLRLEQAIALVTAPVTTAVTGFLRASTPHFPDLVTMSEKYDSVEKCPISRFIDRRDDRARAAVAGSIRARRPSRFVSRCSMAYPVNRTVGVGVEIVPGFYPAWRRRSIRSGPSVGGRFAVGPSLRVSAYRLNNRPSVPANR